MIPKPTRTNHKKAGLALQTQEVKKNLALLLPLCIVTPIPALLSVIWIQTAVNPTYPMSAKPYAYWTSTVKDLLLPIHALPCLRSINLEVLRLWQVCDWALVDHQAFTTHGLQLATVPAYCSSLLPSHSLVNRRLRHHRHLLCSSYRRKERASVSQ